MPAIFPETGELDGTALLGAATVDEDGLVASDRRSAEQAKPSCPGYWEIMVELSDVYECCMVCGERREIGR